VTQGQVQFTVDDETSELTKGDFCFVRQGLVFSYMNVSNEPAGLIVVHTPEFELSAEVFVD
jgi:mannose-6-phosphate isomerase-like protein (cupin superfamily)